MKTPSRRRGLEDGIDATASSQTRRDGRDAVRMRSKSTKKPPTISSDGHESRRRRRKGHRDQYLLELLALGRRLDVLEVDQGVLAEVHDLPEVVEEALVALEALEQFHQGLGADLLVVPAEIENKTTPGIVR